jgi:murein endopeptidase
MMRSETDPRRALALAIGVLFALTSRAVVAGDDAGLDVRALAPIAFPVPEAAPTDALAPDPSVPDKDALRHLVEADPAGLGPLSIGEPGAGLLFNPMPMPPGPYWFLRDPRESFATAETIDFIVTAVEAVEARFPGSPRVVIGDLSRADGGRLNRHRSHQTGRDADIGLYYRRGEVQDFVLPGRKDLDLPRTWALLRALVTETDIQFIFVDRSIQRLLYAQALSEGEDRAWLDDIFGRRRGGPDPIIQHVRRHRDHLHARFYNRHAQEWGRLAYPLLVEAELAPAPAVMHRVRPGETLSHLARRYGVSAASIRAANGLRGSRLRAGRSYVIPVRRMPPETEPTVIPPRRLPPVPSSTAAVPAGSLAAASGTDAHR